MSQEEMVGVLVLVVVVAVIFVIRRDQEVPGGQAAAQAPLIDDGQIEQTATVHAVHGGAAEKPSVGLSLDVLKKSDASEN